MDNCLIVGSILSRYTEQDGGLSLLLLLTDLQQRVLTLHFFFLHVLVHIVALWASPLPCAVTCTCACAYVLLETRLLI